MEGYHADPTDNVSTDLIDWRERRYFGRNTVQVIGLSLIGPDGSTPVDADGAVTFTYFLESQDGTVQVLQRTADHPGTGLYELTLSAEETDVIGNYYGTWAYLMDGRPEEYTVYVVVGESNPAYDRLPEAFKDVVDNVWIRFCVDEETECLTTRGWKTVHELEPGDIALTLNHETGLSEWQPVSAVSSFPVEDETMLSIESTVHSSLTTMDHRWPVLHTQRRSWTEDGRKRSRVTGASREWRRSHELNSNDQLVVAAPHADLPSEPKWSDAFVELVAWFWTEGSIIKAPRNTGVRGGGDHRGVVISQSRTANPQNVLRIRRALQSLLPGPQDSDRQTPSFNEYLQDDRDEVKFKLSVAACDDLLSVAPDKIVSTDFIRELTHAQLLLFHDVSVEADGWITQRGSVQIAQNRSERMEAFELTCILLGRNPVSSERRSVYDDLPYIMHGIASRAQQSFHVPRRGRETAPTEQKYTGLVWCPTTPNHTWLARRRGTVWFTGNTDLFDSPSGGPHLATYYQTHWSRGRMAQLMGMGLRRLNVVSQPYSTYTLDGVGGGVFPIAQWGGLLELATYVEALRHLRRSYLEQPDAQLSSGVSRLDRVSYFDKWGQLLQDAELDLKGAQDTYKISQMFLGTPQVLVSGGTYGKYGPTRIAGSVAARPRYYTRFYS